MERYLKTIKQFNSKRKQYYEEEKETLFHQNFKALKEVCLVVAVATVLMIIITPYVIYTWNITPQHLGLAVTSVLFYGVLSLIQRCNRVTEELTNVMCFIGAALILSFVIAIDIYPFYDQPGQFTQAVIIIMPVLFVFPFKRIYGVIGIFQIIDIILSLQFKTRHMAQNDTFSLIVGGIVSIVAWCFITNLRADNYIIKNRYRTLSMTDALTGILNKGTCTDKMQKSLCQAQNKNEECALILMDIDNFKKINDSYGHQVGDMVLKQFGKLLMSSFRSTDIVGRFGGDEFIVLLRNIQSIDDINKRCDDLIASLPLVPSGHGESITCSIGIAAASKKCYDFESLLKIADHALYKAKFTGKERYVIGEASDVSIMA